MIIVTTPVPSIKELWQVAVVDDISKILLLRAESISKKLIAYADTAHTKNTTSARTTDIYFFIFSPPFSF